MPLISFQTSAIAIAQIFAMGAVGYLLVRRQMMDQNDLQLLSFLSVNIFFPFFIFYQITHYFDPLCTPFWGGFPLINIVLVLIALFVTWLVSRILPASLKDEHLAASSLHNAGYIPLLLSMSLPLGDIAGKVYTAVILSIIGFDLCLWTVGVRLMTRRQSGRQMGLKNLLNPPLLSMLAAVAMVLTGANAFLPEDVFKPMRILGDSALAVAMVVIGGNLALTKLRNVDPLQISGVLLIKLLLLPMLALTGLLFLKLDPVVSFVVMVQACMPTSVTLSIIGRQHGTDNQDFINQSIFFTHILCMFTLPIFLTLYGTLRP